MMKRFLSVLFAISLLGALLYGCSSSSSDAPPVNQAHPDGWVKTHQDFYKADPESCKSCHGLHYEGSGNAPACNSCHLGTAPVFSVHPDGWGVVIADHQMFAETTSWTRCANAACHGERLQGGSAGTGQGPTGPTCMISCHPGGPPAPHALPYTDPNNHGKEAKGVSDPAEDMFYCRNCHGLPPNNFDGGFVAAPNILPTPNPNGACSQLSCHPDAKAHYTNWQGTNDGPSDPGNLDPNYSSTHQGVSATTRDRACALCHKVQSVGVGLMPGAPSCFSSEHTNANDITTGCHPNGPGVAPHATDGSYRDPANHGPDAKSNLGLNFCKECHAQQLADGTYRFNVPKNSLTAGCEDCHVAYAAHPPAPGVLPADALEKWTFHRDLTQIRRTHFAAANPDVNCTLCHGADLTGGPVAPTCYSCHDPATALPAMSLQCTFCHGTPPDGSADLTGSPTPTDHFTAKDNSAISVTGPHNQCATCHGAKDDGTGNLAALNNNYQLLVKDPTSAFFQGGDHLDGQIKMNGPAVSGTGAGYDETTVGCTKACHANDGPHQLPNNSGLTLAYGDFGGGGGQSGCTGCHAYPPDGSPNANPAVPYTPVSHLFNDNGTALLANHNDCLTCHGTKDDGSGGFSSSTNYNPQTDHSNGEINLNSNLQYDPASGGCNAACHGNDAGHQFPNSTGMTITEVDYGTASCASCHEDPSNLDAPQVAANGPHVSLFSCEACHPGGTRGALHAKNGDANVVIIPNNLTVGIDYPASHESGIHLGGDSTGAATEAEMCWGCHPGFMVSEWGQNQNPATGNLIYDYGSLSQSNWVGATWSSAQDGTNGKADFSYKNGLIQSTHSANAAAGQTGVDNVADIRCSYCHDVHDLNKAPGDTVTGKPFLRGNWRGNPYKEDGAPQQGMTFLNLQRFGAVPRGNIAQDTMGGFWIDQNTTPTDTPEGRGWTATDFGGLCDLCHGSGDGQWTGAEIDTINDAGSPSAAWVGTNGHGNSVLGGAGSLATNIFDLRGGTRGNSKDPAMAFQGASKPGTKTAGFRDSGAAAAGFLPGTNDGGSSPSNQSKAYNNYEWGATVDGTTTDSHFHKFSCSKCHSPHAARLPRLMITNCLDTKQNTWAWDYQLATGTQVGPNNLNTRISNWTSAQNCHRRVGVHPSDPNTNTVQGYEGTGADGDRGGLGWNYVTPFIPGGGQENPNIP